MLTGTTSRAATLISMLVGLSVFGPVVLHASCHDRDEDRDGVNSCDDRCPDTQPGAAVDANGCECGVLDDDGDGISNCEDRCDGEDESTDTDGDGVPDCLDRCLGTDESLDADGDGVPDCLDRCPGTEVGAVVDERGCTTVFVHWESPHVHPLEMTADGSKLLALNTTDHRLEVFDLAGSLPRHAASVFVGLEPVSVRVRTPSEVWVVNHVSDSVSIVDLATERVVATLGTGDEPCDVVFAGSPERAFVSISQENRIEVYDPGDLRAPPLALPLQGEEPRALATDGRIVCAAFFESGNGTTLLGAEAVSAPQGPYGGANPPPNRGEEFRPAPNPANPAPPAVGLIVRRASDGRWLDDNGHDWSAFVGSDVLDHDLAVVDARTLETAYISGLMNACMVVAVRGPGTVTVAGTEAHNEVRFEPNLRGKFVRAMLAEVEMLGPGSPELHDLNPHLDYREPTAPPAVRTLSVADPRGLVWTAAGDRGFVTGLGSNNVIAIDGEGRRAGQVPVGRGPTGLALDEPRRRLYVLDKFEAAVSVLDTRDLTEVGRIAFFDPTPREIRPGRQHFYGAHETSGLGQASCASCHLDARMDHLAWDLGDPQGEMKPFNQDCSGDRGECEDWHPMKGPMATQSLVGIFGSEPFHWRGDREGLFAFNRTFPALLGAERELSPAELDELTSFLASIAPAPNPNLNRDGSFKTMLPGGGSPAAGAELFHSAQLNCVSCHALADGSKPRVVAPSLLQTLQEFNVPHLFNLYEKTGFSAASAGNRRGFGFSHDGGAESVSAFLLARGIDHSARAAVMFPRTEAGAQRVRDLEAYLLSFPTRTNAAVGTQITLAGLAGASVGDLALLGEMVRVAGSGTLGLIARGRLGEEARGYFLARPNVFQADREAEIVAAESLFGRSGPGSELTLTLVPAGMQVRLGVDRDGDGFFDRDELENCSDPSDPESRLDRFRPCQGEPTFRRGDPNADGIINITDAVGILAHLFLGGRRPACFDGADADDSGRLEISDAVYLLNHLFLGGPELPPPFRACGTDGSIDSLSCEAYPQCEDIPGVVMNSVGMRLVRIPAGSFLMGSPPAEPDRQLDGGLEGPVHRVTITRPSYMGALEVTQEQFQAVTGGSPSLQNCPRCPVENVSWFGAEEFCLRLSELEGRVYRLPTEAEWEYAARGGSTTRFHFGDAGDCFSGCDVCLELDEYAWWCGNADRRAHPGGEKRPNAWGLFDVHGNVSEWCRDWYAPYDAREVSDPTGPLFGTARVLRGGSFGTSLHACRSAKRSGSDCCGPESHGAGVGFRIVLEVES